MPTSFQEQLLFLLYLDLLLFLIEFAVSKNKIKALLLKYFYKIDVNTLQQQATTELKMNDIARINFKLAQPLMVDSYTQNRAIGAFIVIDESTNNTVGAGMIV